VAERISGEDTIDLLLCRTLDSIAYWASICGPDALIEAAIGRKVDPSPAYRSVWGVDVARFGDDRSAIAKRRGNRLLVPVEPWTNLDTMQLAGRIKADYERIEPADRPSEILVDVIGIGAGVVDRLSEMGLPARGVNVGNHLLSMASSCDCGTNCGGNVAIGCPNGIAASQTTVIWSLSSLDQHIRSHPPASFL
jgi:hypothetical protein